MVAIAHRKSSNVYIDMLKVSVLIVSSKKQYTFLIKNNNIGGNILPWESSNGITYQWCIDGADYFVIVLQQTTLRTIVHECVHMAQYILDNKGIGTGIDNTETLAYLVDYLFSEVVKVLGIK